MDTSQIPTVLLMGKLRPGDVVGFTFFTDYMANSKTDYEAPVQRVDQSRVEV